MLVGEGADQPGCDLGAIDRRDGHVHVEPERREVEAGVVEDLQDVRVLEQARQPRRLDGALAHLHEMGVAVPRRELDETKPVARRVEPHGFRVDRDHGAEIEVRGQVALVEQIGHAAGRGP